MARSGKRGRGRLLVIGGAEDPDERRMRILPRLVEMAGGRTARVVVCSAPSAAPDGKARVYDRLFRRLGVREVHEAAIAGRADAEGATVLEHVDAATAVFFTGGDQLRLTSLVAGTAFGERVRHRLLHDGLVVAGTSAGAAAMGSMMIIGGPSDGTVRRSDVDLAPGLGYWRDSVVDTHFNQRGRMSRLFTLSALNPQVLGVGIDEDTALELVPEDRFTVLGGGVVTVFNGRVTHSNAPDVADDEPLALTDSLVHVLPAGYGFDLTRKRPLLPGGAVVESPSRWEEIPHG